MKDYRRGVQILKDVHRDFFDRVDPTTADVKVRSISSPSLWSISIALTRYFRI